MEFTVNHPLRLEDIKVRFLLWVPQRLWVELGGYIAPERPPRSPGPGGSHLWAVLLSHPTAHPLASCLPLAGPWKEVVPRATPWSLCWACSGLPTRAHHALHPAPPHRWAQGASSQTLRDRRQTQATVPFSNLQITCILPLCPMTGHQP